MAESTADQVVAISTVQESAGLLSRYTAMVPTPRVNTYTAALAACQTQLHLHLLIFIVGWSAVDLEREKGEWVISGCCLPARG